MAQNYKRSSPYFGTEQFGNYLDVMKYRRIPRSKDDVIYQIQPVYNNRPDLLAHDLYGDAGLWWVFMARNPNNIVDPIFDFSAGVSIYLPKKSNINTALGL